MPSLHLPFAISGRRTRECVSQYGARTHTHTHTHTHMRELHNCAKTWPHNQHPRGAPQNSCSIAFQSDSDPQPATRNPPAASTTHDTRMLHLCGRWKCVVRRIIEWRRFGAVALCPQGGYNGILAQRQGFFSRAMARRERTLATCDAHPNLLIRAIQTSSFPSHGI